MNQKTCQDCGAPTYSARAVQCAKCAESWVRKQKNDWHLKYQKSPTTGKCFTCGNTARTPRSYYCAPCLKNRTRKFNAELYRRRRAAQRKAKEKAKHKERTKRIMTISDIQHAHTGGAFERLLDAILSGERSILSARK